MANKLSGPDHIQQFHNYEHYPEHHDQTRAQWWELPPVEGYAAGGSVVAQMRKRPKTGFGTHPAHKIPGVHIVTAEAGEPVFTGER